MTRVARLAEALGAEDLRTAVAALRERLASVDVYVTCVGRVNRGKSSLINAIVGERTLPTGIIPVTSVVTRLRYGAERVVQVQLRGGAAREIGVQEIVDYVSDAGNPGNRRGVDLVDVRVPAPALRDGLTLLDTPGIDSIVRTTGNATRAAIPHTDAVLLVVGADPPISPEELAAVAEATRWAPVLLVAVNKADAVDDASRAEARRFLVEALATAIDRPADGLFEVSATSQLSDRGSAYEWDGLLAALARLTSSDRSAVSVRTADRESRHLVQCGLAALASRAHDAYQPIVDCDGHMESIRLAAGKLAFDALMFREYAPRALAAVRNALAERRRRFLDAALDDAGPSLADAMSRSIVYDAGALDREGANLASRLAADRVVRWAAAESPAVVTDMAEFGQSLDGRVDVVERDLVALNALGLRAAGVLGREEPDESPRSTSRGMTTPTTPRDAQEELPLSAWKAVARGILRIVRVVRLRPAVRGRALTAAHAVLAAGLDAGSRDVMARWLREFDQLVADAWRGWDDRIEEASARADQELQETQARRDRLDPLAHAELDQLAVWRQELSALA